MIRPTPASPVRGAIDYPRRVAVRLPLRAEILGAARSARLSRLVGRRRRDDGTREAALEGRSGRWSTGSPRASPEGSVAISATNGKTTTAAMAAEILSPRFRLAHNAAGANLVSGVASTLLSARDAELGLFEVDEAALPEVARRLRPRALSARQPLPRPARPLRRLSSSPSAGAKTVAALPGSRRSCSDADDPLRR